MDYLDYRRDYLAHHGIKGQKWGVRRFRNEDGTLTDAGKKKYNSDNDRATKYSDKQYLRDKRVYGKLAAKRIDKRTAQGESVQAARSPEAGRIESFRKGSRISGNVGKVVGSILGVYGSYKLGRKYTRSTGDRGVDALLAGSILTGGAIVGGLIGNYGNRALTMLSGGYSPTKQ